MAVFRAPTRCLHLAVCGVGLTVACVLHAQKSSNSEATFTVQTELVTVPVVVTDKSRAHIHGLKKEDFTLLEEGAEQPISVFEEILPVSAAPQPDSGSTDRFSNVRATDASHRQLTMVVLDLINTPVADQIYARNELIHYLAEPANAGQPVSILALKRTGLSLIQRSTSDPKRLASALTNVDRAQQPVTEDPSEAFLPEGKDKMAKIFESFGEFQVDSEQAALSFERRRMITLTLQCMQQIAEAFAGLPGRKSLLWAGAGFPFTINETNMALKEAGAGLDTASNLVPLYEKTWQALTRAQISVYAVDVHGLSELPGPATAPVKKALADPFTHGQFLHAGTNATLQAFAQATAGRAFLNRNGLQTAIRQAVDDGASYYLLAYYPRNEAKSLGWRKLEVRVRRDAVHVLARTGFFLKPTLSGVEDTSKDPMQAALESPLDYTAIPITARWQEIRPASDQGKKKAIFILTMRPGFAQVDVTNNNRFAVDFWAEARTPAGKSGGDTEQTMEGHFKPDTFDRFRSHGTDYRGALTVTPGEYTVRFVVRDRLSGRIGTVSAPLKVPR
jgi:VWFA-related protein